MKPPRIPPDRAFAVDGVVAPEVRATLAEARRIRDRWAAALDDARRAAEATASATLAENLVQLDTLRADLRRDAAQTARQLALTLAERLLHATLSADPARLAAWTDALLATAPDTWIAIRVPPGTPVEHLPETLAVVVDPALAPGDLILEGPHGVVDARVRTRIARHLDGP